MEAGIKPKKSPAAKKKKFKKLPSIASAANKTPKGPKTKLKSKLLNTEQKHDNEVVIATRALHQKCKGMKGWKEWKAKTMKAFCMQNVAVAQPSHST